MNADRKKFTELSPGAEVKIRKIYHRRWEAQLLEEEENQKTSVYGRLVERSFEEEDMLDNADWSKQIQT